jgi:glycosyltransferase involved in cell wall biosynthesis
LFVVVLKVVHVVPAIAEEASGPSYSVRRLCESLILHGHEVTLAALNWGRVPDPPQYLRTFPLGLGPKRLGISPTMRTWLAESVASDGVSLIHNHGMWQMNAIYPAWAVAKTAVQLVYSPRGAFSKWAMKNGSWAKAAFWPLLQRPALTRATCFHATSDAEYEDIRRLGFKQPVAIVPNGIDVPLLPLRRPGRFRTLLFLGRIHPVKGLDMLLPAWQRLEQQFADWQLVIAGTDDGYYGASGHLNEIKHMASRLGLERVDFCGPLYGIAKVQAYCDAEIYVLPSYSENFAVTVAEALACGTPTVVSKGAPWAGLEAKAAGWWSDVGIEPLAAALHDAMSRTSSELQAMGEQGQAWMKDEFAWHSVGSRMSDTYSWLCDRSIPVPRWVRLD